MTPMEISQLAANWSAVIAAVAAVSSVVVAIRAAKSQGKKKITGAGSSSIKGFWPLF